MTKTRQTIQNSEKKDEYELDKHEVSKAPFFLSFHDSKCENKILTACQHACTGLAVFKLPCLKPNLSQSIAG